MFELITNQETLNALKAAALGGRRLDYNQICSTVNNGEVGQIRGLNFKHGQSSQIVSQFKARGMDRNVHVSIKNFKEGDVEKVAITLLKKSDAYQDVLPAVRGPKAAAPVAPVAPAAKAPVAPAVAAKPATPAAKS